MLNELRCNKLIKGKLEFNEGLNAIIGPDDGANSIGKSSVLMLIDFAFSGDDFIKLSSDIIENVGIISIEMDFSFDGITYRFSRATNDPSVVTFISEGGRIEKPIADYREFLKKNYKFPEDSSSFRAAVNPFFRIWGKDNYNPNKPLNSFPSEPYSSIKPNLLKLFSLHSALKHLESEKKTTQNKKNILKGAFAEGYIKPLTKKESEKCEKRLEEVELEISKIKNSVEIYSINANQIVNDENLSLKSEKDHLIGDLFNLKGRLNRIEDNLTYGSTVNKKHFEKLKEYFPNVESAKLAEIDQFHSGVTKILKAELRNEKDIIELQVNSIEMEISSIENKLVKSLGMLERPSGLVDKMLELSVEEKILRDQIRFRKIKSTIDTKVGELSEKITDRTVQSLSKIEGILNSAMSKYINLFYDNNPVTPDIKLSETRYEFLHNDDSGTGKAYANMVAMDMSYLEKTYLPVLIHDLIVFSNIEDHAIEGIIEEYSRSRKQVFIAIDKLGRFKKETQKIISEHKFLVLDSNHLAFCKSWKKLT